MEEFRRADDPISTPVQDCFCLVLLYVGAQRRRDWRKTVYQSDAEKYRSWAAQCLSMAQRAQRDDDKSVWLELAGKWKRLSEEAASRIQQAEQPQRKEKP